MNYVIHLCVRSLLIASAQLLVVGWLTSGAWGADAVPPRLSPRGIEGGVIAVGAQASWMAAVDPFVALLGKTENPIVLVCQAEADANELPEKLRAVGASKVVIHALEGRCERAVPLLREAAGVWLLDDKIASDDALQKELRAARERGALVVGRPDDVLTLCPALHLSTDDKDAPAGSIGVTLHDESILGLHGRMLFHQGTEPAQLKLARSASREPRTVTLRDKQMADYNELCRAAWGRTQAAYPAPEIGTPEVKKGALVIVGGGGMPKEIAERFVELGGGAEGRFIVLPTAMPDPLPPGNEGAFLERFGAKHVTVIKVREQKELETPENLAALESATAIWFGGGRQWRFVDAYEGTKVYDLLHQVLERGGVIGGSSAGATIQGEYLVRGAPAGPHIMMCEGYERGFAFLPGVAIDQHFKQRNRFADMTELMNAYPQYLGIGIDEATALVVQGSTAEILGRGEVHFYDRRVPVEEGKPDHQSYAAGKKYDLQARKPID